ncbi:MAG: hypothetical protein SAK29_33060 [Scytonema sp. PMC 1069.18]|nr:hypothetical protein [Scytonema sp. PMC 1069.18]MEC4887715.1 hypothetical protein [Scytonema sp. PMC 1070.18]
MTVLWGNEKHEYPNHRYSSVSRRDLLSSNTQSYGSVGKESGAIFQAVGTIKGDVKFHENGRTFIVLGGREYRLFYIHKKRRAFDAP